MTRAILLAGIVLSLVPSSPSAQGAGQPAAAAFEKLKALEGDWVDVEGIFGKKGAVAVTYRVTGGGTSVVESFPVDTPGEMATVYHHSGPFQAHALNTATHEKLSFFGLKTLAMLFSRFQGASV